MKIYTKKLQTNKIIQIDDNEGNIIGHLMLGKQGDGHKDVEVTLFNFITEEDNEYWTTLGQYKKYPRSAADLIFGD